MHRRGRFHEIIKGESRTIFALIRRGMYVIYLTYLSMNKVAQTSRIILNFSIICFWTYIRYIHTSTQFFGMKKKLTGT
jgi:hypothetical protein